MHSCSGSHEALKKIIQLKIAASFVCFFKTTTTKLFSLYLLRRHGLKHFQGEMEELWKMDCFSPKFLPEFLQFAVYVWLNLKVRLSFCFPLPWQVELPALILFLSNNKILPHIPFETENPQKGSLSVISVGLSS